MTDHIDLPYRPCAGIMLVNAQGKVFVGQRLDSVASEAWQMPQGGIDEGEDPETAALRELGEETSIATEKVSIIGRSTEEYFYDLPEELMGNIWGGKYRGQRQFWFLMRFLGEDGDVNIQTSHAEFSAWRWADPEELPGLAVPFKRRIYRAVLDEFAELI